jgi:hypothetical protein
MSIQFSSHADPSSVVLESTFPTGEVARREYPIARERIPPGSEPDHWPVLATAGAGRLLLDTDALRAVWTGPRSSPSGGNQ